MSAEIAHEAVQQQTVERAATRSLRARVVLGLGPATMLAGLAWALWQPYRLTFLHPHGEGFWWLVGGEAPLFVVLVGLVFWRVVARPLAADLDGRR
jgi:uncharacterized protein (UPF0548 family)